MIIRNAIANLCHPLGYPTTAAVYVTEIPHIGVVCWIHAHLCLLLETSLHADIGGFIVDEKYCESGIGRQLLLQIEQWAS